MALKCFTYNCRGWNNGCVTISDFIDSFDLCFIQEHWLLTDQLHLLSSFHADFSAVSVSGVKIGEFVCGRPYGGCAILYRSSFSPCITPLNSTSNRFCALKIQDNSGTSILLVNVYMPSQSSPSDYLDTLGVLEGFIESYQCDVSVIVGDFNVDFSRDNASANYLSTFMASSDLVACDLTLGSSIRYTDERDGGSVRSWIDHILCNGSHSHLISQVCPINSGVNFSDHLPISFVLAVSPVRVASSPAYVASDCSPPSSPLCNWSKAEQCNIDEYRVLISASLPCLSADLEHCCVPDCSKHKDALDSYSFEFIKCIVDSACHSIPCHSRPPGRTLAGWNHGPKQLRSQANFWYQVWVEAGCPSNGVLSQIKKRSKQRFKYAVRKIRRQQSYIKRARLANAFSHKSSKDFWASVKRMTRRKTSDTASIIDGVCGDNNIAELWASKLKDLLNTNNNSCGDFSQLINGNISFSSLSDLSVTPLDVRRALRNLKTGKKDIDNLSSDHLRHAAPVIAAPLAALFTSILRHGYMPSSLRDCTVLPIPKGLKDASCSSNYRGIAIASILSKVLEGVILLKYSEFFTSSDLQFGFKSGHSTTLCTGVLKCTISRYINRNSFVYGCFLDASKAFDLVDHKLLFSYLFNRGLPPTIIRFLMFWYKHQTMSVRWNGVLSESFHVSNGVRQGGVLSPVLFSVYVNGLLCKLKDSGVGCHLGCEFVGSVCYADDLALLAPSPSALRIMLNICEDLQEFMVSSLMLPKHN